MIGGEVEFKCKGSGEKENGHLRRGVVVRCGRGRGEFDVRLV